MRFEFNIIRNKSKARIIAMIFISIALSVAIMEFIANSIYIKFTFENLVAFLFEFIFNAMLLHAIWKKAPVLIEIALVVIKAFEGTYYPIRSAQRLDALLAKEVIAIDVITYVLFSSAATCLLLALVFFCTYKSMNNKPSQWHLMKLTIIIATVMMVISTGFYIAFVSIQEGPYWGELFEPVSLAFLFAGMFFTCEYVEEETLYA